MLSEREWSEQEKEEFFSSQDAITGLLGGGMASNWSSGQQLSAPLTLKDVKEMCDQVERTPKEGEYWRMNEMCANEVHTFRHNMILGMKGYEAPIKLRPRGLEWAKEK
jgi:hypothetical protein